VGDSNTSKGFTLLELTIVIVLIGVLSVVATSRYSGRGGFDTYALQSKIIASLRQMQFRAMQDTRANFCHQIVFDTSAPALGPPSHDFSNTASAASASCVTSIGIDTPDNLRIGSDDFAELNASLSAVDGSTAISFINFTGLGRPLTSASHCSVDCRITVATQTSASVCINREGFIRGC
jgi:MSHA pilin protein MshC